MDFQQPLNVRKRTGGKIATTGYVAEVVDAVNNSFVPKDGNRDSPLGQTWVVIGAIVSMGPNGEANLNGNLYWVEPLYIKNDGAQVADRVEGFLDSQAFDRTAVPATDLSSQSKDSDDGSRNMNVGDYVALHVVTDSAGKTRFVFWGTHAVKFGTAVETWDSGNEVVVTPCKTIYDPTETGEDNVTCFINTPSSASPTGVVITAGDILAYLPIGDALGILINVKQGGSGVPLAILDCNGEGEPDLHTIQLSQGFSLTTDVDPNTVTIDFNIIGDAGDDPADSQTTGAIEVVDPEDCDGAYVISWLGLNATYEGSQIDSKGFWWKTLAWEGIKVREDSANHKLTIGGLYDTGDTGTLGSTSEGSDTANTSEWDRTSSGDIPINLYVTCRVVYSHGGDEKLYGFYRKLEFDNSGMLHHIGPEVRYEIDAPEDCV